MDAKEEKEFSLLECIAFLVSMIGVQLSSEMLSQWGTYFYSPPPDTGRMVYVSIGLVAFMFMFGRAFDIVTDLWIGVVSDRSSQTPGRGRILPIAGRRRPFIFWGSLLMTVTGIVFWYPPVQGETLTNFIYGTLILSLHLLFYTLAYIPLLALAPEIARSAGGRVELGTWIAVGMIVGLVAAALLPGALVPLLDPARHASADGEQAFSPLGYQRVAIAFALISLACFQFFVWVVKERKLDRPTDSATPAVKELLRTLNLPVFRLYIVIFFFFYIGLLADQRAIPYWVELGLGGDEAMVSTLGIPFMVTCLGAALVCPALARRFQLKWLVAFALLTMTIGMPFMYLIATMDAGEDLKFQLAAVAYGIKGIGLGMMYVLVTPLIGEIIDLSERVSGERSEAVFNAMHAVMVKAAQVLGIWVAAATMSGWGNSKDHPLGVFLVAPVSSLFCLVALVAALFYPVLNPVKKEETS